MLLLFIFIICASCSIPKKDQDKHLAILDIAIRSKAARFSRNFEHPTTRKRIQLNFIQEAWTEVFGSSPESTKVWKPNDIPVESQRNLVFALSKGLIYVPLADENDTISILAPAYDVCTKLYELSVINTPSNGLETFRSRQWCRDPFWADAPPCIFKDRPEISLAFVQETLDALRKTAIDSTARLHFESR